MRKKADMAGAIGGTAATGAAIGTAGAMLYYLLQKMRGKRPSFLGSIAGGAGLGALGGAGVGAISGAAGGSGLSPGDIIGGDLSGRRGLGI